jgi:hypothetical protein
MEIIVDCYGEEERAMGWYCYLQDKLTFPFLARCIAKRASSPLKVADEVDVLGMAPDEECEREMFVVMRWEREGLAVPLSQLEVIHTPTMKPKKLSRIGSTGPKGATGSEA